MQAFKKDIKFVRSLGQKKFRQSSNCFIAEGLKLTREALASQWTVQSVYTTDDAFLAECPSAIRITAHEMEMISQLSTPSSHLAVVQQKNTVIDLSTSPPLAILDGISDPGNLGTILRTADWFGIRDVYCTNNCVELTNPKVVQSTMGSIFRSRVQSMELSPLMDQLKQQGYGLVGAVLNGESLYDCQLDGKQALVIGSESHGISENMKLHLTQHITIPGEPGAESLNASIAAGILFSTFHRQCLLT